MEELDNTIKEKQVKPRGKNAGKNFIYNGNGRKMGVRNLPRITTKVKKLVKTYIATGNKTQSALAAYNTKEHSVAYGIANETLAKPHVQSYMQSLIAAQITDEEIAGIHVRNAKQTENWPTSQKAVESLEIIKGLAVKSEKESGDITVNILAVFSDDTEIVEGE